MGPARAGLSSPQFCWQSEARPSGTLCTNSSWGTQSPKGLGVLPRWFLAYETRASGAVFCLLHSMLHSVLPNQRRGWERSG